MPYQHSAGPVMPHIRVMLRKVIEALTAISANFALA